MRRGERRAHGGNVGKAALEEQQQQPPPPAQPNGGAPGAERDGAGPRRSTESEVYDDGTNTFFW